MTTVPLWEHIIVVLALVASNTTLFLVSKRRIERLQMALVAKRVLLGEPAKPRGYSREHNMAEGDILELKSRTGQQVARITAKSRCSIDVEFFG